MLSSDAVGVEGPLAAGMWGQVSQSHGRGFPEGWSAQPRAGQWPEWEEDAGSGDAGA